MQTFLPYADFERSLWCLDMQRLGKQRVETFQLLKGQWENHPCSKMWRGYSNALTLYYNTSLDVWAERGKFNRKLHYIPVSGDVVMPPWFGDPAFHRAHKSNLLRKNPYHYGQHGWNVPNDLPYIWPT